LLFLFLFFDPCQRAFKFPIHPLEAFIKRGESIGGPKTRIQPLDTDGFKKLQKFEWAPK
jgi:hypothetical protein